MHYSNPNKRFSLPTSPICSGMLACQKIEGVFQGLSVLVDAVFFSFSRGLCHSFRLAFLYLVSPFVQTKPSKHANMPSCLSCRLKDWKQNKRLQRARRMKRKEETMGGEGGH